MSYLSDYFPLTSELTPSQLKAGRDKAVSFIRQHLPEVSLEPGSPSGDALITPGGLLFAGLEEAHRRHMSDLDLGNVAAGVIYSCDFVRAYLGNFGVYDTGGASGYGLIRLTFSTNEARDIPVHMLFRFGTDDFRPRAASEASVITLTAAGNAATAIDSYELAQTSATTWAVDIPVIGASSAVVLRGASCLMSVVISNLIGAVAAVDFASGTPAPGLSDLAAMARKTAWACNSGSRGGVMAMIYRNWPEACMVSPVVTGDMEMVRVSGVGPTIIQPPLMDVYFRSQYDLQVERQTVRLAYEACDENSVTAYRFRGRVSFLARPSKIISTEWAGTTSESQVVTSLWCSDGIDVGTTREQFFVSVTPAIDGVTGLPTFPLVQDVDGLYAMFTITYLTDPALASVTEVLEHPENASIGIDTRVVAGPLVDISAMTVEFARQPGVKVLTDAAASEISSEISSAGYPEAFRPSVILDAMAAAGAGRVKGITCAATIRHTPATRLFVSLDDPGDTNLWDDWVLGSVLTNVITVTTLEGLSPSIVIQDDHGLTGLEHWAATDRTIRHYLPKSAITFLETL